jgi:hypothetical protein
MVSNIWGVAVLPAAPLNKLAAALAALAFAAAAAAAAVAGLWARHFAQAPA